jgi:hypothetical protein
MRQKPEIESGAVSRIHVDVKNRDMGASVDINGLYAPPEPPGDWSHKSSARGRESQIFRPARNILFMKSVGCRYIIPIEGITLYRQMFLLGQNSSPRGRWMHRSEKNSKIFFSPTV